MTDNRKQKNGSQKQVVVQQATPQASPEEASPSSPVDTGIQDSQQPIMQPATTQDSPHQASRANHRHSVDAEDGYRKFVATPWPLFILNTGIVIFAMMLMSTHLTARIDALGTRLSRLDARIDGLGTRIDGLFVTARSIKTILEGYLAGHAKNLMKSSLALLVSSSKDGNNQGCGTLAYSNALQQAVIVTNRHVVVDDKSETSCRRKVVVKTWSGQTSVSKWLTVKEPAGVDIAVGLMDNELNLPLLNISSRDDVDAGMKLSALSLRNSVKVALSAQVIKIKQHKITTDARMARGYSGTGYVDYLGRLSAIHIGQGSATEFSGMGNNISAYCDKDHLKEDGFCEIQIVEAQCASSLRLGATGYGGYIDACLALAGQAANLPDPSPNEHTCLEGWRMHRTGRLDEPVE